MAAMIPALAAGLGIPFLNSLFSNGKNEDVARLQEQIRQQQQQNAELLMRFDKLLKEMKDKKIDSFEALAKQDQASKVALIELSRQAPALKMDGKNVGVFGLTSTGKSTMLNSLLGKNVAATGVGETTKAITPYEGNGFKLWDVPGRNDELSYFTMEYISFFKGLQHRVILIQATVKENSSMMKLLDEIGLRYDIVFNKFDKVDEDERSAVQQQIQSEITSNGLRGVNRVFFVSAKHPQMFADWVTLVNMLTG